MKKFDYTIETDAGEVLLSILMVDKTAADNAIYRLVRNSLNVPIYDSNRDVVT